MTHKLIAVLAKAPPESEEALEAMWRLKYEETSSFNRHDLITEEHKEAMEALLCAIETGAVEMPLWMVESIVDRGSLGCLDK